MAQAAQTAQSAHLKDVKMITIAQEPHDQFNFSKEIHPADERMRLYGIHRQQGTKKQITSIRQYGPYYLLEMDVIVRENDLETKITSLLVEPHEKDEMRDYIQDLEYLSLQRDTNGQRQSSPIWKGPDTQNWIPPPFNNPYNLTFHNNIVATY